MAFFGPCRCGERGCASFDELSTQDSLISRASWWKCSMLSLIIKAETGNFSMEYVNE